MRPLVSSLLEAGEQSDFKKWLSKQLVDNGVKITSSSRGGLHIRFAMQGQLADFQKYFKPLGIDVQESPTTISGTFDTFILTMKEDNGIIKVGTTLPWVNNYIGADLAIQIKDFEISNSNSNINYSNLIDNNGNNVVNNLYNLERAILTTNSLPINSKKTSIFIDANEIIEILPNNLIASGSLYLNPNGNLGQIDFLYPDYPPETNIKFDVPLNINTKELTLIDTSEINFPSNNNFDISSLYLNINNGFPFSANIKLISLDSENNVLDTIKYENTILPGLLSNQNNNINPQQTIIEIDASKIQQASKLITVFTLSTVPANQHIKIYDFYSIKFLISAVINQKLND